MHRVDHHGVLVVDEQVDAAATVGYQHPGCVGGVERDASAADEVVAGAERDEPDGGSVELARAVEGVDNCVQAAVTTRHHNVAVAPT